MTTTGWYVQTDLPACLHVDQDDNWHLCAAKMQQHASKMHLRAPRAAADSRAY